MLAAAVALLAVVPATVYAQADGSADQGLPSTAGTATAPDAGTVDSAGMDESVGTVDSAGTVDSTVGTVDSARATDAAAAGAPALACTLSALRIMTAELNGVRFTCRVAGASPADTSFFVRATRTSVDPQLAAILRAFTCTGSLAAGVGECTGGFVDRAGRPLGELSITATLQPSGTVLGPVALGLPPATPSGAPAVNPAPLRPTAPTAPLQFFPLPEP
jgi:hypothetical protein